MGIKPNKVVVDEKTKKYVFTIKVILGVIAALVLICAVYYAINMFLETTNYFIDHFLSAIMLALIGVMAILMPQINQRTLRGENKGDNMMLIVGFLLFFMAIMSIVVSYVNF